MQMHVACMTKGDGPLITHLEPKTFLLGEGNVMGRWPRTLALEACVSAYMCQIFL